MCADRVIDTSQKVADSISPHLLLIVPTSEQARHEPGFQQESGKWDSRSPHILWKMVFYNGFCSPHFYTQFDRQVCCFYRSW